ncbi:cytochrome c [Anaeromyxobacter oryzae]|uniref:cytochrome c n=1 Tax=Anaeromyxobacter oryzae TaxID=2918170 RepID=UPI0020BD8EA2|nr:cytochrome c [Anaeromyxobacter oryzae]
MGSADAGARLFSGQTRLAGGGPSCAACHAIAGLPFPGGGTMGPDLTGVYARYGPEALGTVLATLFFPTMDPVFAGRLLTPAERADLQAFMAASGTSPAPAATGRLLLFGLLLLAAAAALMAWLGRARLCGVRAALVADARRAREGRP